MPFYEYQCRACGKLTEVLQKVSDPPLRKCPECGKAQLVKLVSAPVFRLKGGGWYETDFKSDAENKRNLVGEKEEAKPEKKEDAAPVAEKPAAEKPATEKSTEAPKKTPAVKPASTKKPAKKASARARR
jgi:putative FmdB family regulatory protein